MPFENRFWWSRDGLRLHFRDYAARTGAADRPPVICLPGLTRNARDYHALAEHLSEQWRVLAVSLRGRGESAHAKDAMSYVPLTYVQDLEALLDEAGIARFVAVGTSLGGIVTILIAAADPGRLAGAVLNDVGPEIDASGLARIRGYVGKASSWPTWLHAARAVGEANAAVYPHYGLEDWLAMAKRLYRLSSAGRIVLDYDLKIAEPFKVPGAETGPDMWAALAALRDVPTALIRGDRSDIFSPAVAQRMVEALPQAELTVVPDVGHAPTLSEPAALAAVERLLARVAAEPARR